MQAAQLYDTIDTHTAGEPTRIIVGGVNWTSDGQTVREQRDRFATEYDQVRELLMKEPRGHNDMFGAMPVEADNDRCDFGLFFMDNGGYLDMCGHATMGVVTMLIETGQLESKSELYIETPARIVEARPTVTENGQVTRVAVQNVSSFLVNELTVTIEEIGPIDVTVVYSGNFFAMVDVHQLGRSLTPKHTKTLINYGLQIREAVNEVVDLEHPLTGHSDEVTITEFYESRNEADRNIVIFADGSVDRSPCGTGTCAKMTMLYEEEQLAKNEPYLHESVLGTRFEGHIRDVKTEGDQTVTVPEVAGSAHIISKNSFMLDPADTLKSFSGVATE